MELRAVALRLHSAEVVRRRESADRLHGALRALQSADSSRELADKIPQEVAKLGFNRVLFSWVDHGRWVPVSFRTVNGPEEARAVMAAGEPPYWHTRSLLEGEMVMHRQPMLVRNALDNPRVHLDIQAVMHSHSYVAAPVVRRGSVVGFVHADQNVENDAVDELDRGILQLFAEGVSLALDRVAMLEELAVLRQHIGEQASALRDLVSRDLPSVVADPQIADSRSPAPRWADSVTRREEEVLALISAGLSNAQIAERLYVTEGTAKTHVKNVLRKLGADNRVQAGAMYRQHWEQGRG
ncbi:LuxR C-terminal-related transcriptional regulator [Nocardioides sp. BE266]|uniref:LuxR C-terminal-related transcriptional regulator n=1 Tax=Nocardioides sp. BE266 TaxID=2817725 RepID=UPI00286C1763|nr:LuxR C-terminal-related transcriptional regulator [Nocardioides sp. BE266]